MTHLLDPTHTDSRTLTPPLQQHGAGHEVASTPSYSPRFQRLIERYEVQRSPVDVSFRDLVGPIPIHELTHSVYPYPGKLLRQIPRYFMRESGLVAAGDLVVDPFCGSGTVLVEALAANLDSWGLDVNPLARLISEVKLTFVPQETALQASRMVSADARRSRRSDPPPIANPRIWYSGPVLSAMTRLRRVIDESSIDRSTQHILRLSLALTGERCSLRDPRIPVPVRRKDWEQRAAAQTTSEVFETFERIAQTISMRVASLAGLSDRLALVAGSDARCAGQVATDLNLRSPRLILTSPPYGAAQKYVRSSSLALGWTGLARPSDLAGLEHQSVGREHLRDLELPDLEAPTPRTTAIIESLAESDPRRAAIYAHYFRDMDRGISEMAGLLPEGGHLVLIGGSNMATGLLIETHDHLREIAQTHSLHHILSLRDQIRGRTLLTKRANISPPLAHETIHIFRKLDK